MPRAYCVGPQDSADCQIRAPEWLGFGELGEATGQGDGGGSGLFDTPSVPLDTAKFIAVKTVWAKVRPKR
jgi:hypothetical protein